MQYPPWGLEKHPVSGTLVILSRNVWIFVINETDRDFKLSPHQFRSGSSTKEVQFKSGFAGKWGIKKLIFEIPGNTFGLADKGLKICVSKLSIDTEFLDLKSLLYNLVICVRLWREHLNAGFPGRKANHRTFKHPGLSFKQSLFRGFVAS